MKRKPKAKLLDRISQILNNKNNFEKYEIELFDELLSKEEFQTLFQHQIKRMEQQIGQMERGKSSKSCHPMKILNFIKMPLRNILSNSSGRRTFISGM